MMIEILFVVLLKDFNRNGVKFFVDIWIIFIVKKKVYLNKYVFFNIIYIFIWKSRKINFCFFSNLFFLNISWLLK